MSLMPDLFFKENGFLILENILPKPILADIEYALKGFNLQNAGSRELLTEPWCCLLANQLKTNALLNNILPKEPIAIQCTFFQKTIDKNWLVPLHQDLSIPLKEKLALDGFSGWSTKQGITFAQPPAGVLEEIVAVRIHLDDCHEEHGALKVVSGTHLSGRIAEKDWTAIRDKKGEQLCSVNAGGAIIMRPLILHSSSKAEKANGRRVLHFLFVPKTLSQTIPFLFTV